MNVQFLNIDKGLNSNQICKIKSILLLKHVDNLLYSCHACTFFNNLYIWGSGVTGELHLLT